MSQSPRFPHDIEREIFETASLQCQSTRRFGPLTRFMLVASRVQKWVEPILYRVLVQAPGLDRPRTSFEYHYPPRNVFSLVRVGGDLPAGQLITYNPRFAKYVRNALLSIPYSYNWYIIVVVDILQSCSNIRDLALWCDSEANPQAFDAFRSSIERIPLQRLSIEMYGLIGDKPAGFYILSQPTLFSNITHLHVQRMYKFEALGPSAVTRFVDAISVLSQLTHFATTTRATETIHILLCQLTNVTAIVINVHGLFKTDFPNGFIDSVRDKRLVFTHLPGSFSSIFGDWEAGALGRVDCWAVADQIQTLGVSLEKQLGWESPDPDC